MRIGSIHLAEFRSYSALTYRPSPRLNLITGRNAQGKTNLLEAVAVLLTGRSFRTSRLAEIPMWGSEIAHVNGDLQMSDGVRTVRRTIHRQPDGSWQTAGSGCPWARVIVFGWQDLAILNGAPSARRGFIDGFASRLFPGHLQALLRYRQVITRRNHLLQARVPQGRMAPWDEQLASLGMELIDRRRRAVAALQTELARVYAALAGQGRKVEVSYRTVIGQATDPAVLLSALESVRREEGRRRVTLVGPHRDDLGLELDGVDARSFGSRGEQRLLALALRLAEVIPVSEAAGTSPVLLLDDALSELDPAVQEHVLREVRSAEQVFLTSPTPLAVSGAQGWVVDRGGIAAA